MSNFKGNFRGRKRMSAPFRVLITITRINIWKGCLRTFPGAIAPWTMGLLPMRKDLQRGSCKACLLGSERYENRLLPIPVFFLIFAKSNTKPTFMKHLPLLAFLAFSLSAQAQKKPLDHSVYDSWQHIAAAALSADGRILTYQVDPQEGDGTLFIRNNRTKRVVSVPRGYKAQVLDDGIHVICLVKPLFQQTRQAKIKKKKPEDMPKDTLAVIDLKTGGIRKFGHVLSHSIGKHAIEAIAFSVSDTTLIPKKERKSKDVGKPLFVYHFASGRTDTLRHVDQFTMNRQGTALAYTYKYKKHKSQLALLDFLSGKSILLGDTLSYYSLPQFSHDGTKMLYLESTDTAATGNKHCALYEYKMGTENSRRVVGAEPQSGIPTDWGITENSSPHYSRDGERIFVGIQQYTAPDDTTLHAFETPALDIWRHDALILPPTEKAKLKDIKKQTCTASVVNGKLVPLTTSLYDKIRLVSHGNAEFALSIDRTPHMVETQWNHQIPLTVSLVNLETGQRKEITTGRIGHVTASPSCKYVAWYDLQSSQWMACEVATGLKRNLTCGLGVNFFDEEDDHPMLKDAYGIVDWTEDDRDLIVYDRFDLWRIPLSGGKAMNLTRGEGRNSNCVYRYVKTRDDDDPDYITGSERLLLNVFDRRTKRNGIATTSLNATLKKLPLEEYMFSKIVKAHDTNSYAYLKGNFQHSNDVWLAGKDFARQQKISSINPQQKEYNWGSVELIHWTAFDGKPMEGLLYKPEDFDENKQYPVMIYFYEKYSENRYRYVEPQPSWSTVNLAFYTSRGYLVFVPDIVYTTGTPGESAYNCVVSGAKFLTGYPWVDKQNMGIQGQSWGGYQVAYLITRTNMFKAAEAGAPVSNMTSAFGGIRWESGSSRQGQYEQGQSRIGRNLWEAPELYISNSALFKLPEVQTPLLIMHNDADGAVPWYQGIELFMGLRRLGKPVWMLEYNNEAHNLKERRNRKDLTIRLQQFFDYQLKGAPEPEWMRSGIPILRKGQYFAY